MKFLLNTIIFLLLLIIVGITGLFLIAPNTKPEEAVNYLQKLPLRLAQAHLTDPEARKILKVPALDAFISEKQKHLELVESIAIATDTINFKNCLPDPLAAKMREGKLFKAVNPDSHEHKILIDNTYPYKLAAKQTTTITASFGRDGAVPYKCDDSPTVGIILITRDY